MRTVSDEQLLALQSCTLSRHTGQARETKCKPERKKDMRRPEMRMRRVENGPIWEPLGRKAEREGNQNSRKGQWFSHPCSLTRKGPRTREHLLIAGDSSWYVSTGICSGLLARMTAQALPECVPGLPQWGPSSKNESDTR